MEPTKKKLVIDGIEVFYTLTCNTKEPVGTMLFLHGWGGNSAFWEKNISDLSLKYRCIALDLPGFGISGTPKEPWNIPLYSCFIDKFIDKLQLEELTLVGKSFGGRIAIHYASEHKDKLSHLILIASAGIEPRGFILYFKILLFKFGKILLSILPNKYSSALIKFFYGLFHIKKDSLPYKSLIKGRVVAQNLSTNTLKINTPTLIIWGSSDRVLPLSIGKKLHKLIKGSKMKVITNGGHDAHITHPKEVNEAIIDFIKEEN